MNATRGRERNCRRYFKHRHIYNQTHMHGIVEWIIISEHIRKDFHFLSNNLLHAQFQQSVASVFLHIFAISSSMLASFNIQSNYSLDISLLRSELYKPRHINLPKHQ